MMVMVKLQKEHSFTAILALKRVITKGRANAVTPTTGITDATFRNEAMDMRIPFEVTPKGMENTDKTRSKALRFIVLIKTVKDNATDSREKTVKESTVL